MRTKAPAQGACCFGNSSSTACTWIHPVTIGTGKRLFANGTHSGAWNLVKSRVGDAGVIIATYEPVGTLVTGTIGA